MEPDSTPLTNCSSVWAECLGAARAALPPMTYDSWLADSVFEAAEDDNFYVRFTNDFKARWARAHYGDLLQGKLRDLTGRADIKLVCVGDPAPPRAALPQQARQAPQTDVRMAYLHPSYTFERFIAGPSNELAYAGAHAVSLEPGHPSRNPLFIYGGVGLGKTHLIQAIAHKVRRTSPEKVFWYVSSEQFTQLVVSALRDTATPDFRDFRRRNQDVDLLLMDDVQFLVGKERTIEEFFHRFNDLYQQGKQIVLTSDRAPREIELDERMISRFESGLVADIQPPEYETRLAILELKAREEEEFFPPEVLQYIASSIKSNVRQLEGAVHRLTATSRLRRIPIDMDLARATLADTLGSLTQPPSAGQLTAAVAEAFGVSPAQLRGQHRRREILIPRQVAMFLLRELTRMPLVEIGQFFSGRDHSTVLNAIERIRRLSADDPALRRRIQEIRGRFSS
jgi:chromosomal replication initiator protein